MSRDPLEFDELHEVETSDIQTELEELEGESLAETDPSESVIGTLRYLPPQAKASKCVNAPTFEGQVEYHAATSLINSHQWIKCWVQVIGCQMLFWQKKDSAKPQDSTFITWALNPSSYIEAAPDQSVMLAKVSSDGGAAESHADRLKKEFALHYRHYSERELTEHMIKVMTPGTTVIFRCQSEQQKLAFLAGIEASLRPIFGEELWGEKADAAKKVQPLIKKQIFTQRYRMEVILQSLKKAGLVNAASSMLASSAKKFQGIVTIAEIGQEPSKAQSFFMILHDTALYWFANSNSPRPDSFMPLNYARISLDTDRVSAGNWSFILTTPLRSLTVTTRHAIALCEWFQAIKRVTNEKHPTDDVAGTTNLLRQRKLSMFSALLRGGNFDVQIPRSDLDLVLVDDMPNAAMFSFGSPREMNRLLSRIVDLRVSGITLPDLLKSAKAIAFLDKSLDRVPRRIMSCLMDLMYQTEYTKDTRQAVHALVELDPSSEPSAALVEILQSDQKPDIDHIKQVLQISLQPSISALRSKPEFRMVVQEILQIGADLIEPVTFENPSSQLVLVITDQKSKKSQVAVLDPSQSCVTVGRDCSNDIVLSDKHVSRSHVRLVYAQTHVEIFDLGSSTGIIVNGVPVKHCSLVPGDTFTLGSTDISFQLRERTGSRLLSKVMRTFSHASLRN